AGASYVRSSRTASGLGVGSVVIDPPRLVRPLSGGSATVTNDRARDGQRRRGNSSRWLLSVHGDAVRVILDAASTRNRRAHAVRIAGLRPARGHGPGNAPDSGYPSRPPRPARRHRLGTPAR